MARSPFTPVLQEVDALFGAIAGLRTWAFSGAERRSLREVLCDASTLVGYENSAESDQTWRVGWRARLLRQAMPALASLRDSPPSTLVKRRIRSPIRNAREFDEYSLIRLASRPGVSVRDKLAFDPVCVSVARTFSNDVVEFDVARRFCTILKSIELGTDDLPLPKDDEVWIEQLRRHPLVAQSTPRARLTPTNRLLRDPVICRLWRAYLEARAARSVLSDRFAARSRILCGALRLLIGGCSCGRLVHVRPSTCEIDLRALAVIPEVPIEVFLQTSESAAVTLLLGVIEESANGDAMFRVGDDIAVRVLNATPHIVVEREGLVIVEAAVASLTSILSLAQRVHSLAVEVPYHRGLTSRRRGWNYSVDLGVPSRPYRKKGDETHESSVPFAAADSATGFGKDGALGGLDALGWRNFEAADSDVWIGEEVLQHGDAPSRAAMKAIADGGESLVVVTDDSFDPARDSRLIACQPRLVKGLVVLPRAVVALEAARHLRTEQGLGTIATITVVNLNDRPSICNFTRERQSEDRAYWVRDPGHFMSSRVLPHAASLQQAWSRVGPRNWRLEESQPSANPGPNDTVSAEALAKAIRAATPTNDEGLQSVILWIEHVEEQSASAVIDRVEALLPEFQSTRLQWDRDIVPATFRLAESLFGRLAGEGGWWCDRRPVLEIQIGSSYLPLFGGSLTNQVVHLGQRYVERSRVFELPSTRERDVRLSLRQTLRGRVLGEGSVQCRLDEENTQLTRVYIGTEFVYGESTWKLELRRVDDDRVIPGGTLQFTRADKIPEAEGRNYAPHLAEPLYWSDSDGDEVQAQIEKSRRVVASLEDAVRAWKRAGRKRGDSAIGEELVRAKIELDQIDEVLRRKMPSTQSYSAAAESRLCEMAEDFDSWVKREPLALSDFVKADAARKRDVELLGSKLARLRTRLRVCREGTLTEITTTLRSSDSTQEKLVHAAELLAASVRGDFSGAWGELIATFIDRFISGLAEPKGHLRSHGTRILTQLAWSGLGLRSDCGERVAVAFGRLCEVMLACLSTAPEVRYWCLLAARLTVLRNTDHDAVANIARTSQWATEFERRWKELGISRSKEHVSIQAWVRSMQACEEDQGAAHEELDACAWIVGLLRGTGRAVSLKLPEDLS